jgi:hypothetical protein
MDGVRFTESQELSLSLLRMIYDIVSPDTKAYIVSIADRDAFERL